MGQGKNRQDVHGNDAGRRATGQKIHRVVAALGFAGLIFSSASAQPSPSARTAFDEAKAWSYLTKQCDFGPRKPGTDAHKNCRDFIKSELAKFCDNVELQPFTHKWTYTNETLNMWNVVATQNWERATQRVVLAAHWDSRALATEETDPAKKAKPIPGANDGASGVAVLLELARVMKDANPKLGIMYVMFDGEDLGPDLEEMFLGAIHWSAHLPEKKPNYGILLDMIGDADLEIPVEPNSAQKARPLVAAFYNHAAKIGLDKTFPKTMQGEILDDHLSMNDAGVPTMDLIDFTYAPWHTLADTPDKCSAASLGKVGKMLQSFLSQSPMFVYKKD